MLGGASNIEPDWLLMDYADLISAESRRCGDRPCADGPARRAAHAAGGRGGADAIAVLAEVLGDAAVRREGEALVWTSPQFLAEFLSLLRWEAVSAQHVTWLASLLWLEETGGALQFVREGDAVLCRVGARADSFAADLAVWIEQF